MAQFIHTKLKGSSAASVAVSDQIHTFSIVLDKWMAAITSISGYEGLWEM